MSWIIRATDDEKARAIMRRPKRIRRPYVTRRWRVIVEGRSGREHTILTSETRRRCIAGMSDRIVRLEERVD